MLGLLNNLTGGEDEASDKIEFNIDPELKGVVPKPTPASKVMPDWYKNLDTRSPDDVPMTAGKTAGACMAFLDAMSLGWILKVPADIHWKVPNKQRENEVPKFEYETEVDFPVMNTHLPEQLGTQPDGDFPMNGPIVKFKNPWTIKTPEGYSTLFTHPMNRPDRRFYHLSGVVETDKYSERVNGGAIWKAPPGSEGIIKQGTPYAQIIPFKRDDYIDDAEVNEMDEEKMIERKRQKNQLDSNRGHYKKELWEPKATKEPSCPLGFGED